MDNDPSRLISGDPGCTHSLQIARAKVMNGEPAAAGGRAGTCPEHFLKKCHEMPKGRREIAITYAYVMWWYMA